MTEIDLDKIAKKIWDDCARMPEGDYSIIEQALLKVANATREETIRECAEIAEFLKSHSDEEPENNGYESACGELNERIRSLLKPKETK